MAGDKHRLPHLEAVSGGAQQGCIKVEVGWLDGTTLVASASRCQKHNHRQQICNT